MRRIVWLTCFVCAITLSVHAVGLAVQFWRVLPVNDQWSAVWFYDAWSRGAASFDLWFAQHNEHRIPLVRLAFLIDLEIFRGQGTFIYPLLLAVHIGTGVLLGHIAALGMPKLQRLLPMAVGVTFLVAPIQIENLTSPFHLGWSGCGLFALLAFYGVTQLASAGKSGVTLIAGTCVATILAVYSSANGLAAAAIVCVVSFLLPIGIVARISFVAVSLAAMGGYFVGYHSPPYHEPLLAVLTNLPGIQQWLTCIVTFLGAPLALFGIKWCVALGVVGLSIWCGLALLMIARVRASHALDPGMVALMLVALFAIGSAVMIALGRASLGPESVTASRYMTTVMLFWGGIIGTMWRTRLDDRKRTPIPAVGAAAMTVAIISVSYFGFSPLIRFIADRAAAIDVATVELRAGKFDEAHMAKVYPFGGLDSIQYLVGVLRKNRVSIFAE